MANSGFRWVDRSLQVNLKQFDTRMDEAIATVVRFNGADALGYAKTNARWTDRTGNARNGLGVEFNHTKYSHGFAIYHRVPYGLWLEVRWSGKYAIIASTIQRQFPKVMSQIAAAIGRG